VKEVEQEEMAAVDVATVNVVEEEARITPVPEEHQRVDYARHWATMYSIMDTRLPRTSRCAHQWKR
jgi:hypothetical protein